MTKLFDALLADAVDHLRRPDVVSTLLRPILASLFHIVYPYLLGAMILWVIMFICVALILLILVRGTLLVGIQQR